MFILDLLKQERDKLVAAIAALEGTTPAKKIGRPRKEAAPVEPIANVRKARTFSAKQRAEQSARPKAMWKKRKAATKKS
jgi:hypothetical protein